MTVRQISSSEIQAYGADAIATFALIDESLGGLISCCAEVNYHGANALAFKSRLVDLAFDLSRTVADAMEQMGGAMADASSTIATALGGNALDISAGRAPFEMPRIEAETAVESVTSEPLLELRSVISDHHAVVDTLLIEHLNSLQGLGATGWIGPEFDDAMESIGRLTMATSGAVLQSRRSMLDALDHQLSALGLGT